MGERTVRRSDWVAYVGLFEFPWGQPGSRRVFGIAASLAAAGRQVVVGSGEHQPYGLTRLDEVDGPGSLSYLGLGELPGPGASPLSRATRTLLRAGERTVAWLARQPHRPSHVLVYGGDAMFMFHLGRWCRRHDVPLIADVVEWYDPRHLRGGPFGPLHVSSAAAMRYFNPRCDGVIAISSHLERYYRRRGLPVLRMPPTLDVAGLKLRDAVDAEADLTLVYTGTPGRKDLLAAIVRAVAAVERRGVRVELRVYGPSTEQVAALCGGEPLPRSVRILGRLPQTQVPDAVQAADFSVLLRPPARYAQAGFPTKFCESLANGTPVITNVTSDLDRHLTDGIEGFVVADHSSAALTEALLRAARTGPDRRRAMRAAARRRALDAFDYRAHTGRLAEFVDDLRR